MYHPSGLTKPNVSRDTVNSIAGSNFSIDCNFSVTPNLVGNVNVQWLNSSDSLVSENNRLMFPYLLTSHGGNYTCKVTVSIPLLNITLAGTETTIVIVQSKSSLPHLARVSFYPFLTFFALICVYTIFIMQVFFVIYSSVVIFSCSSSSISYH